VVQSAHDRRPQSALDVRRPLLIDPQLSIEVVHIAGFIAVATQGRRNTIACGDPA
jgi:hypothetical protein